MATDKKAVKLVVNAIKNINEALEQEVDFKDKIHLQEARSCLNIVVSNNGFSIKIIIRKIYKLINKII
jgi:hypothetical protein